VVWLGNKQLIGLSIKWNGLYWFFPAKSERTNSKLIGKDYIETNANALIIIFLVENIDFWEKYFDNDAWIAVKSLVKLYKDKFVCKLCLEAAEKIAYNVKFVNIFFILNAKMIQLITKKHMSVEDGNVVVLKWPLKTNNKKL